MDKDLFELTKKIKHLLAFKVSKWLQEEDGLLNPTDIFALESLDSLSTPTISKFANFVGISQPNASYKVNSLIKKGYIQRIVSEDDKRECKLALTDKYTEFNDTFDKKISASIQNTLKEFSKDEITLLNKMVNKLNTELNDLVNQE